MGREDLLPSTVASPQVHVRGFDVIRVFAMLSVTILHIRAISLLPHWALNYNLGVPVFAVLSGYLALQSEGEIAGWLGRRLKKILVPYWLALTAMLLLNYAFHYKPTTLGLILAQ